jgi:type II secretory pathway pseudopilin PulG
MPHPPVRSVRRHERGVSLVEMLGALLVLAVGLLSHVSSTLSEHRLAREQSARTTAIQAMRDVIERLRADEDFPTLYARLRTLEVQAEAGGGAESAPLADGGTAWPLTTYFPTRTPADGELAMHVLVEVPPPQPPQSGSGTAALRENATLPAFGLPADLDGDGAIDDDPHDADYATIPIVVILRYASADAIVNEMRTSTWIGGTR